MLVLATTILGMSVIGYGAVKKSAIKKTTKSTKKTGVKKLKLTDVAKTNNEGKSIIENYTCGNEKISVEFGEDKVKLKNSTGEYILNRKTSGSGELYSNSKGMSIHTKGNEAIYNVKKNSEDIFCKKENTVIKSDSNVMIFKSEGKNLKVEYTNTDKNTVKVTDFQGNVHTLKRAKSASGEYFVNDKGVELQFKGNEGIFSLAGIDYPIVK